MIDATHPACPDHVGERASRVAPFASRMVLRDEGFFAYAFSPPAIAPIPFIVIFLRTLLHSSKTQPFCFQAIPNSLRKTTGGGGRGRLLPSCPSSRRTAPAPPAPSISGTWSECLCVMLSDCFRLTSVVSIASALFSRQLTKTTSATSLPSFTYKLFAVTTGLACNGPPSKGTPLSLPSGRLYQREQHWLGGRSIGDGLELRVLPAERLRHFYFRSFENVEELQGVDHGLALEMIVRHHKRLASPLRDFADARHPRRELFGGVEIVVTLVRGDRCIVAEPRVIAPAVKSHVPYGRGSLRGGAKRAPDDGLVDVAETPTAGAQQFERLWRIPRTVAYFDHQRIVSKAFYYGREVGHGLRGAMKRKRELQQDRPELICRAKH